MLEHGCIGIHRRVIIYQVHIIYICGEREREKRERHSYTVNHLIIIQPSLRSRPKAIRILKKKNN